MANATGLHSLLCWLPRFQKVMMQILLTMKIQLKSGVSVAIILWVAQTCVWSLLYLIWLSLISLITNAFSTYIHLCCYSLTKTNYWPTFTLDLSDATIGRLWLQEVSKKSLKVEDWIHRWTTAGLSMTTELWPIISSAISPEHSGLGRWPQFPYFWSSLPTEDESKKAKYTPQPNHVRCLLLGSLPPASPSQKPLIRAYLKFPFLVFHCKAFPLPWTECLWVSIKCKQSLWLEQVVCSYSGVFAYSHKNILWESIGYMELKIKNFLYSLFTCSKYTVLYYQWNL